MVALYLDHRGFELRADGQAIALYEHGKRLRSLPARLLERVVVHGEIKLSAGVLTRLADAGCPVLFLSKRNSRRVAMALGGYNKDAKTRLWQFTAIQDDRFRHATAAYFVHRKVVTQSRFLSSQLPTRPDKRRALLQAVRCMERILQRFSGAEPMDLPCLLGIEGAASSAYFAAYPSLFAPSLGFTKRLRRPPPDPVNAALSLTYTMLHHEAIVAAHSAGLDPYLGFLHAPSHGRESLACDLVEIVRARADRWVLEMFHLRELRDEHFSLDKGRCCLSKSGRANFYKGYEPFAAQPRKLLNRAARFMAKAVMEKDHVATQDLWWKGLTHER